MVVISAHGDNNQIIETHTVTVDTAADSLNEGMFLGTVPEPGTTALLLAGLLAVGFVARRRRG